MSERAGHRPSVSDRRPRVWFFNRSYWPDSEATGQLLTELCEDLTSDFAPTVVSGQPNSASFHGRVPPRRHGVEIRQVRHTTFPKRRWWGRLANWCTYMIAAGWVGLWARRPHVVVVETDPPMLCLLGAFLKLWRRCKLVVYLQDIYPDVAVVLDGLQEGRFSRWLRTLFFAAYRQADRIVVLSTDMRDYLVRRGISSARISIVPNWVDVRTVRPVKHGNRFRRRHDLDDKFVAMYSGNLGLSQRLENVLEAADRLRDRSDVRFVFVGEGASKPKLEADAAARGLTNVTFLGYQPKETLGDSLSAADLHLIALHPKVLSFLMPSKLYGILASGTACLATAPESTELAETILGQEVGLVVPPDDPAKLAEAIRWAADRRAELAAMGDRAYRLAQTEFDRPLATGRFAELLAQVLGEGERAAKSDAASPRRQVAVRHDADVLSGISR